CFRRAAAEDPMTLWCHCGECAKRATRLARRASFWIPGPGLTTGPGITRDHRGVIDASSLNAVMRGLDPRIHDAAHIQNSYGFDRLRCLMDCRVKPGNDTLREAGAFRAPIPGVCGLFRPGLTQSLLFDKTLAPVATGDGVGFLARHCIHLPADRQPAALDRLAFLTEFARRSVADRDRVLRLAAREARPARSPANDPARAFS